MNDLIEKAVFHHTFGSGTITAEENGRILVSFLSGDKKFTYPDSFKQFLTAVDGDFAQQVRQDLAEKEDARRKELAKVCTINVNPIKSQPRRRAKPVERSNIAFKCNFCNGGATDRRIGFHGVCSDLILQYNIEEARHPWCSDRDCPCRQYLNGEISRGQLTSMMRNGGYICYESAMLRDWRARAGTYQTGDKRGTHKRLKKVQPNSLTVLTTRKPFAPDSQRFIFAVFLVDEHYEGDARESGFVLTNSKWKLELTPDEAPELLFWNYYACPNDPEYVVFGSGLYRYITDEMSVQILRDIVRVKRDRKEKSFAREFLEHYCTVNGIDAEAVPPPNGALLRKSGSPH